MSQMGQTRVDTLENVCVTCAWQGWGQLKRSEAAAQTKLTLSTALFASFSKMLSPSIPPEVGNTGACTEPRAARGRRWKTG